MSAIGAVEGLVVVATGIGITYWRVQSWRRKHPWVATELLDPSPCAVDLVGGPYGGRTVTIAGLPAHASKLDNGLVRDGFYVIESVDSHQRRAVASFELQA